MKHLITYKLFENNSDIELEIKDAFLKISDMGFDVDFKVNKYKWISVILKKDEFTISDIKDELEMGIKYIERVIGLFVFGFTFPIKPGEYVVSYNSFDRAGDPKLENINKIDEVCSRNGCKLFQLDINILTNANMDNVKASEDNGKVTSLDDLFS